LWLADSGATHSAEALWARRSADDFGGRDVCDWAGMQGRLTAERRRHPRMLLWTGTGVLISGAHHGLGNVMAANAAADYGKTFLIAAGLLNFIAARCHHIALGRSREL